MGEDRKWLAEGQSGAFEPLRVFEGTPREAAICFPANLNVAVALSLAGIGPDRMTLEIWADPSLERERAPGRGRLGFCKLLDVDRSVPSDNPKKRPHHRALCHFVFAQTGRAVAGRLVWTDSQAAPIRPRQRRPQKTPCFVPEPRRTAPWCIRAGARQKPPTSCPVRRWPRAASRRYGRTPGLRPADRA
jgi:Domain of unknown function DUF108